MVKKKKKKVSVSEEQIPDGVQKIFDDHREKRLHRKFIENRGDVTKFAMITAILLIVIGYFWSPFSRTAAIAVNGNHYLSSKYIEDLADVHVNDIFYFNLPMRIEAALKKDPFIDDADVKWQDGHNISIQIQEKQPVGYRYIDQPELLFVDGTTTELKEDFTKSISKLPLITGFESEEQTRLLCKAFTNVKQSIIERISEISQYELSYDDETMKILMSNGGYYVGTYRNLSKLNYYYSIYNRMRDKTHCISASDTTNVAWHYACPWEVRTTQPKEYWTDEDGQIIKNQYGDDVVKRYYTDASGNTAVDENGNPIVIPIDAYGNEIVDENFIENYENGSYASGTLNTGE